MTEPGFTADVYQNEYLPEGGRVVDAVVTVTAASGGFVGRTSAASSAQVIIIDTSGSMAYPPTKLTNAKKATLAAVHALHDGVPFAIVSGDSMARMVYPTREGMEAASPATRARAENAVRRLSASGGTAMSTWLKLAERLFAENGRSVAERGDGHGADVNHAILLTDGQNGEPASRLTDVLGLCEGKFVCDSRGVGTDWRATELRQIASALLGSADGLESPEQLPDVFQALTERAMGKEIARVSLRLWTPAGSTVRFVKQVFPHIEDLTGRRTAVSDRIGDYPTGAWGAESRDYHVSIEVEPDAVGEEILAARVSLVAGERTLVQKLVLARWTDDTALSTRLSPHVAHYTGQADLAAAIQEGMAARAAGDDEVATAKLGAAVRLAAASGRDDTAKLLRKVVDVVDEESGTVRLKRTPDAVDAEIVDVRSTVTRRVRGS
ncbi:VWA domain-containing protein [Virgisporangium ochraceum]|uniref:VWA domain-containing protein n=1 Tax=Virgisporangium ochraceum TaxID=65505 RepID=A0A8J4EGA2_9ACTN|nr:VWA domain-containing protein [Virgisporangium ochraceum]GIJ73689.1 VWA domain-containing protein [Virgisporangium ochraceum]